MDFRKRNSQKYTPLSAFQPTASEENKGNIQRHNSDKTVGLSFEMAELLNSPPDLNKERKSLEQLQRFNKQVQKSGSSPNLMTQSGIQLQSPLPDTTFTIQLDDMKTKIYFPRSPYPQQVEFVKAMADAILTNSHALLESPTGTGKTLSVLSAGIGLLYHFQQSQLEAVPNGGVHKYLQNTAQQLLPLTPDALREALNSKQSQPQTPGMKHPKRIFYASRTHSQIIQLVAELKTLPYRPAAAVLASRDKLCVNSEVEGLPSSERPKKCEDLIKSSGCKYYSGYKNSHYITRQTLGDLSRSPMDIEQLYSYGKEHCVCPYFASKDLVPLSHIVFIPYTYITEEELLGTVGDYMDGSLIVFDEAHNASRSFEEGSSCSLDVAILGRAIDEIKAIQGEEFALGRGDRIEACTKITQHLQKMM